MRLNLFSELLLWWEGDREVSTFACIFVNVFGFHEIAYRRLEKFSYICQNPEIIHIFVE